MCPLVIKREVGISSNRRKLMKDDKKESLIGPSAGNCAAAKDEFRLVKFPTFLKQVVAVNLLCVAELKLKGNRNDDLFDILCIK